MITRSDVEASVAELSSSRQAELVMRVIESAADVRRRNQFFVWSQSYLQMLLPHDISVCAAYHRSAKELVFETFHNVPVPPELLALLGSGHSALMRQLIRQWNEQGGGALIADVAGLQGRVPADDLALLQKAGIPELLLHAVARPQRPDELESLFALAASGRRWQAQQGSHLELLLPYLHTTYMRAHVNERDLAPGSAEASSPVAHERSGSTVTLRELQILRWVRDGKTNAEIAVTLGISPLTVKNHVQKILRKLSAANRAQAVAMAIKQNLM